MSNGGFFLRRAYHFFEFTSLSARFSSIDSASIVFNSAFSFSTDKTSAPKCYALGKQIDRFGRHPPGEEYG
jgi:hypothetical protein